MAITSVIYRFVLTAFFIAQHAVLIAGKITGSVIDWSPEKPRAAAVTLKPEDILNNAEQLAARLKVRKTSRHLRPAYHCDGAVLGTFAMLPLVAHPTRFIDNEYDPKNVANNSNATSILGL